MRTLSTAVKRIRLVSASPQGLTIISELTALFLYLAASHRSAQETRSLFQARSTGARPRQKRAGSPSRASLRQSKRISLSRS